jgi:hypothetical protein
VLYKCLQRYFLQGDTISEYPEIAMGLQADNLERDRFRVLVVRVLGYRLGGPGSIPGTNRKKVMGLERGPLSLVCTTQELLDRKVAVPV